MQIRRVSNYTVGLLLSMMVTVVAAKEVSIQYKGLTLNADISLAEDKTMADGVMLITHGALAHRDMETITYIRKLLKEKGYSTLAINLSLGINNRHGMYDCKQIQRHRNEDAAAEIGVWADWLQQQGASKITLFGHSRGGAQTALYAAKNNNPLVDALVLMAPAIKENTSAGRYQKRHKKALQPLLDRAQQLVSSGKGQTVFEKSGLMTCGDTPVTANTFVSYYGPQALVDTPYLITQFKKPVLVVVGGNDEIVVGLEKKLEPLVDGKRVYMTVIDGAGHMFRDLNADDAVDEIDDFLSEIAK